LQRNSPYFGWIQAFTELGNYVLMESEAELARWRQRVLDAVGAIGRVLTDVIPNLELIIGPQPALPALDAAEAQNRLRYVFMEFLRAIATREHPLVVFLDDLQWIDAASLSLLQTPFGRTGVSHLLIIGAYRDNEVDALHPLSQGLEVLRKEQARIHRMILPGLFEPAVNALISDTLNAPPEQTFSLAHLVYGKTGGNPFFLLQTLRALMKERAILFDLERRCWRWDIAALSRREISDNAVALMVGRIQQLPPDTQQVLRLAACTGFRFSLTNLSAMEEHSKERIQEHLRPALLEGIIMPLDGSYQFVHDRIQQAAYSLIPEAEKKEVHLRIGRLLLRSLSEGERDEQIFTVADHLNTGAELLEGAGERGDLARLNVRAGRKARACAAFDAASRYFQAGLGLLNEEAWTTDYDLALDLHSLAAEAAALVGDFERTDRLSAAVIHHAREAVDMVRATMSRMMAFSAQGRLPDFMACALEILDRLGVPIDPRPSAEVIQRGLAEVMSSLDAKNIQALIHIPASEDPRTTATMRVLGLAQNSAYSGRPDLFALFVFEAVKRTLRHGSTPESMHAFCHLGLLLCGLPGGDVDQGFEFGALAMALAEKASVSALAPPSMASTAGMTWVYKRHLRETLKALKPLYPRLKEVGDFEYAGYAACWYCSNSLLAGNELVELEREMAAYHEDMKRIRAEVGCRWLAAFWQAAQNLLGRSRCPWVLDGEAYDRSAMLLAIVETGNLAAQTALHVNTLALCYLFGRHEEALAASELAEKCRAGMVAMAIEPVWYFYDSLTRLALCPGDHPAQRSRLLERVAANQTYLGMRAHHAPMNFQNKLHLVEAERARVLGHGMEAMEHYDRSIQLAQQNAFIQEEALANERAGRFWLEKGKPEFAQVHLRKAHDGFARWQAWAKVKALEAEFPEWLGHESRAPADRAAGSLDVGTVIKAAHAFASEMEMERLLGQVMRSVIENAGAQRGLLLLEQQGQWVVGASGTTDGSDVEVPRPPRVQRDEVALGAVRFVARTRGRLVLDDAANAGELVGDPHVRQQRTKSLLCSPLLRQGRLTGILYMENNLTTHAFTQGRVELLEVLLSLAATLLENARIYEALRESESRYRRIVDTANEGIWVLGADGRTSFVNSRMADMLGYAADQIIGRSMDDFMFEEDVADHLQQMEKLRRGMAEHYERRLRRKDGTTLWAVVSATPISDDEHRFQGSFGMLTDVTERKQAEQSIFLLNYALDNVRECAFLIDEHARFQFANEEACRILGYSREDLLRMGVPDVDPDFPRGRWLEHWRDLRAKRSVLFEGRHRTRDGHMIPVEINANYFEHDRQGYNLALVRDITERKQAEAAILRLNRDLERRVAQRTAALERANKELETFSYSVSHDLRAPLRHIAGFASILQEDYGGALDARGRRYLHLVNQGAASMGRLIDDILAFSRMSRSDMRAETVNMTALARVAFAELETGMVGRRIRFILPDLPNARGDRAMLRRVWSNLLDNAIKYTAHKPEAVIEVSGSVQGAESLYCVKDNGAGFDMRYAGKLFGVFQRLHSAEEFEGTGIGLAMIQRIVTRHGGRVWAEGRVNEGAAFSFALPTEAEAPPKARLSAAEWTLD
jgi:PAS domain S-box-containing protein